MDIIIDDKVKEYLEMRGSSVLTIYTERIGSC